MTHAPPMSTGKSLRLIYLWDADYPWDVRVEKICASLTEAGHDVHIVARNRGWRAERERLPEGTVHRMPRWRWVGRRLDDALGFPAFFSPRWYALLARTAREIEADAIIARDLPLCPTAIRVGRELDIPVIHDMAENYPAMMRKIFESRSQRPIDYLVRNPRAVAAVERYCLPRLDHVLVVVEESGERLRRLGVPADRITVVSNTPPVARAQQEVDRTRPSNASLEVVYLGLIEITRGIGEIVVAARMLREAGERVRFRLVGGGRHLEHFRAQAKDCGLNSDDVDFLGYVQSHDTALRLVAEADVGLIPNHACEHYNTTIPNKLFDYMAAALPVVTSDAVPFARVTRECSAGEVFRSKDPSDLVRVLLRMKDSRLREAYGRSGRAAVRRRYNWEYDASRMVRAVEDVVRSGERPRPELLGVVTQPT